MKVIVHFYSTRYETVEQLRHVDAKQSIALVLNGPRLFLKKTYAVS